MPDGTNAENTGAGDEQAPGTPEEQISQEIASERVLSWWRGLFGSDTPHETGGGGTGGQYMFANIDELNSIITKWEEERDGIESDRNQIAEAYWSIQNPAGDMMSRSQALASQNSLANMYHHSDAMLRYANNYLEKLYASRDQMQVMEDGARENFRNIQA